MAKQTTTPKSKRTLNEDTLAAADRFLTALGQQPELRSQWQRDPLVVLGQVFPEDKGFLEKNWSRGLSTGVKRAQTMSKRFTALLAKEPASQPGLLDPTLTVAVLAAYVACSKAAEWAWIPFGNSERLIRLDKKKLEELIRKKIITEQEIVGGGHAEV
jgi:hypothetical protein